MLCVSLILTTFNSKENFIKTYTSICRQTWPDVEIVVVDGASTDGTREEIAARAQTDPRICWISEKDDGIYQAMNKGLRMAKGDIIAFFNDEFLVETAIEQYVRAIESEQADGAHSDLIYRDTKGKIIRKWEMGKGRIKDGWLPGHPTLYLKKEVYQKYGEYKEDYRCSADYEFMVRILKDEKIRLAYIPEMLIAMFYGGTSSNGLKAYWISFIEGMRALQENKVKGAWKITILRICKVLKQFI